MINGDVRDFLERRDRNEWTVFYKGKCYFFQANYYKETHTTSIQIQSWKAHTDLGHNHIIDEEDKNGHPIDYFFIDLPHFPTYQEAIKDFLKRKLFDNNTKTFFEVQEAREWLG